MVNVKFFTLGCKVNQYDTQAMREQFLQRGCTEDPHRRANVCVVNTCTVTRKTDTQSYALIRRVARDNPQALIVVTGCLAQTDARDVRRLNPGALVVGNRDKRTLASVVMQKVSSTPHEKEAPHRPSGAFADGISFFEGRTRAFLKVQDGCDNFCSYCKVPIARGRSRSRPVDDVVREARQLSANGYREIVLCGVCLGAYGKDLYPRRSLADILEALEGVAGLKRIRLSSIEAADVSGRLIAVMARSPAVCRHLHIPLQSGDDHVLEEMNRKYSRSRYLALIRRIRKAIPDIALTTDVLVGFPGETEKQFMNTARLIAQVRPLRAHVFPYSERQGTRAAGTAAPRVGPVVMRLRAQRLRDLAAECARGCMRERIGKIEDVLFEERRGGVWIGHTGSYIRVSVPSDKNLRNKCVAVRLDAVEEQGMAGTLA